VTDLPYDRDNYCYRHPDRQSFILCQRCGRTVCPACASQAAVGVHCPECVKEAKARAPRSRSLATRTARAWRPDSSVPVITYSLIALCVVVYIAQLVFGESLTVQLAFYGPLTTIEPWRYVTALFAHASPLHLLSNMFSLFMIGRILEPAFGRVRFTVLYFLGGFGGSVAVLLTGGAAIGASGAIFALLGALFMAIRRIGGSTSQLVVLVALNLALGFIVPGIAWEAHIGGLVVGVAIGFIYGRTIGPRNRRRQVLLVTGVGVLLAVIAGAGLALLY
jgi:membrane associated rhomboid family serine protease